MPLVSDLSDPIKGVLDSEAAPSHLLAQFGEDGFDLERLLDFLASPPPFLDDLERVRHKVWFGKVANMLRRHILTKQLDAQASPPAPWVRPLTTYWGRHQSNVITMNYDTLVESAASAVNASPAPVEGSEIRPHDTLAVAIRPASELPNSLADTMVGGPQGAGSWIRHQRTLRLFKLHGSLSWYYPGLAGPGQQILDIGSYPIWPTLDITQFRGRETLDHLQEAVPGWTSYIMPPVIGKHSYFDHEVIRQIWIRAAAALRDTTHLVIYGYSFPAGDETMAQLLRTNLPPDATITVADPAADEIADRLNDRLLGRRIDTIDGTDPIGTHVDTLPDTESPDPTAEIEIADQ